MQLGQLQDNPARVVDDRRVFLLNDLLRVQVCPRNATCYRFAFFGYDADFLAGNGHCLAGCYFAVDRAGCRIGHAFDGCATVIKAQAVVRAFHLPEHGLNHIRDAAVDYATVASFYKTGIFVEIAGNGRFEQRDFVVL